MEGHRRPAVLPGRMAVLQGLAETPTLL